MDSNRTYWLLLEKSDETRISKGIDGYQDKTGESYHYDSLVPNHKNLAVGDFVVLRKENDILGVGRIGHISESDDAKIHRRCPECNSTDIRERSTKSPKWKCGKCSYEFAKPKETITDVRSYAASIENFARLNSPPTVRDVKLCAASSEGVASQLSMLQLDRQKIITLLEGVDIFPSPRSSRKGNDGQGFGLSQVERKAVELHAMRVARVLYESAGWTVVDKSGSHPFDLLATKGSERRFVEVKGTTGEGNSIILTNGEVEHARLHREESALVIVAGITLVKKSDNQWTAAGGIVGIHEDPWCISKSDLVPTQFRYETCKFIK